MVTYETLQSRPPPVSGPHRPDAAGVSTSAECLPTGLSATLSRETEPPRGDPVNGAAGGGCKGSCSGQKTELLFVLVYLKTYPLQAVMGELFGLSQPRVNYWIHRLLPVLRGALDDLGVLPSGMPLTLLEAKPLPERNHASSSTAPNAGGSGRKTRKNRPSHYSGKKKAHTDKNVVIVTLPRKRIDFLSRTCAGKTHDKKIADTEGIAYPPEAILYKDTGFQGYDPAVKETRQAKKKAAPRRAHRR